MPCSQAPGPPSPTRPRWSPATRAASLTIASSPDATNTSCPSSSTSRPWSGIRKYSAHPLEEDSATVYHQDDKDYYEVELRPEDGPYPLPYVARRANGSGHGQPFEEADLFDPDLDYGGRQFFYPDASRMFAEIDRTIPGRDESGEGSVLDRKADYDFIRVLPPGGYTGKGEKSGVDYFPYRPLAIRRSPRYRDLAKATNAVRATLASVNYAGGIWLEGSPTVEGNDLLAEPADRHRPRPRRMRLPSAPTASSPTMATATSSTAVDLILSGLGSGIGAVGVQDERIYAAREFKKADDRPRQLQGHRRPRRHPRHRRTARHHLVQARLPPHLRLRREPLPPAR